MRDPLRTVGAALEATAFHPGRSGRNAAALLGEPRILILDEPANGLDPQGMRWLRDLLRDQAASGRTVLVSSHLLSEIAQTAEELVVIRDGKLVAQTSLAEFTAGGASSQIRVRASDLEGLAAALGESKASVSRDGDGALVIGGLGAEQIGELALRRGIALHELTPQQQSLEDRFFELMGDEEAAS